MIYAVFAGNLLLTILVEGGLTGLLFRRWDFVRYTALCNLLTNPLLGLALWGAVAGLGGAAYWPALAALEAVVVAGEAVLLCKLCRLSAGRAAGLSLLLNAASYAAGLMVNNFL